ncbi:unnamed protein product [Ceutorhynchus assimilis]|uniref:Rapamycin-insensitive companion of mTOR n=1 Tax=Ceutorhynchus assimilis TaxID=467358 RepID=A0A9N9MWQ7_9CUCU|nr:unnamed protein product [Ceutorhynchus assimilis]
MAVSSWMLRSKIREPHGKRRNIGTGTKNKKDDLFTSCLKLEPQACFKNLLSKLCYQNTDEKDLLTYLNTMAQLLDHYENKFEEIKFSKKEILTCLRLTLMNESCTIRSAGLRCIRHTIQNNDDVASINNLRINFLISKSLDLKNDMERIEAIKLIRKIGMLAPDMLDMSMTRSLVALANEATECKDRLLRICLATLSEICLINPTLFIKSEGVQVITRNLIDCQIPKIAEALCGVLLLLMDKPDTRAKAAVDLYSIAAPFCDFHYKHGWKDITRDERKVRLNCSRLALLTVLKSWPGLLHFCNPKNQGGFRTIVEVLHLKQIEVRKAVLDLLYDLLGLQQPEWTDELSVALSAIDPCEPQSSWRLKEDFIAAEGRSILPHLAKTTPSPTEMHLALLLFCFLECGLLGALTEVITSSDTFISVRATVLLGELIRLIQLYLPPGCSGVTPSMPSLLKYATTSKPQALSALLALVQLHKLMQKRPASYSLHLDYIIRNSSSMRGKQKQERHARNKGLKSKLSHVKAVLKDGDDIVKETGVLSSNEVKIWNWNLIKMILKGEKGYRLDLTDSSHRMFLRRLLDFFKPSQKKYSHTDLSNTPMDSSELTSSGLEFVKYLAEVKDPECQAMVLDFFKDVYTQITSISTSRSVHDCLFSPAHMHNTHCQSYFLFIGQFARTESGLSILESIKMFSLLQELATTTRLNCYVKLIISSLDYSCPGPARDILDAVLTCNVKPSRLYATQFLLVLLRTGYPSFAGWAVRLLCKQLEDEFSKVRLSALAILQEACELPDCLETLTDLQINLAKLGEKGEMVAVKLLSTEKGYKKLGEDKVLAAIAKWVTTMNYRYTKIVEGEISDCLTLHQKNEDGKYDDQHTSNLSGTRSNYRKDIILPPHLYGQLNQYAEGFQKLTANGSITALIELIHKGNCSNDKEILQLKSALWAVGHLSTSNIGFVYLNSLEFVGSMIRIATKCPVYGVRSTAFYALGLVATTTIGSDELYLNGWLSTRHNRHKNWPVLQEELLDEMYVSYFANSKWEEDKESSEKLDGIREDDEITLSEEDERLIEYPASPALSPDICKIKQWTLPATRSPSEVGHKRYLSESKTFDGSNGYEVDHRYGPYENVITRQRNSSMTESTTSGVSSCDSLPNRQGGGPSYLQTLSPIPSSTSLSILKLPHPFERRIHKISTNSAGSEASTSSLSGSNTNDLSLQNMLGYQTIRYIRRRDSLNFQRTERDDYLFRTPPIKTSRRTVIDSINSSEPRATIHYSSFSMAKFEPIYEPIKTYKPKDAIYRGICLPRCLDDVFPSEQQTHTKETEALEETLVKPNTTMYNSPTNQPANTWKHHQESCIYCSQILEPLITDFNGDHIILKISERLAVPAISNAFKTQVLRLKQKDPDMFENICVYSEVCKMFSECSYCLEARRILHELFLDVVYDKCFQDARKMLGLDQNSNIPKQESRKSTGDIVLSPTEFKTLDSLKLISAENKFPIRTRKNTT